MQRIIKNPLMSILFLLCIIIAASGGYLLHHRYYLHHFTTSLPYNPATLELNTALTYLGSIQYQNHTPQEQYHVGEQIIHHCKQSLAIEPSASAHYHLGIALRIIGQPYQAINEFEHAINIDRKHGGAYLHLAATFVETQQFDAAIDIYQNILKQQPDNTTIQHLLSAAQQARAQTTVM